MKTTNFIKANIKGDARTFIALSLKHFSDYFTNRYCRVNAVTPDDITIVDYNADVVVSPSYVVIDGDTYTITVWGSDDNPRYNGIDYLGDGIYSYFQLSPKDLAFAKADLYDVYNKLYDRSQQYWLSLPRYAVYHDCGLYVKDPDTNDDGSCVSYNVDYDNFTDVDKRNHDLYKKFQDKANWIAYNFGLDK